LVQIVSMDRGSGVPRPECYGNPYVGCNLSWCFCLDILRHAIFTLSLEVDFSLSFTLLRLVSSDKRENEDTLGILALIKQLRSQNSRVR
jgi:hypothetical protein